MAIRVTSPRDQKRTAVTAYGLAAERLSRTAPMAAVARTQRHVSATTCGARIRGRFSIRAFIGSLSGAGPVHRRTFVQEGAFPPPPGFPLQAAERTAPQPVYAPCHIGRQPSSH